MIVHTFSDSNIYLGQKNVDDNYTLKGKEAFSIEGFYKPIWDDQNNQVIEGETLENVASAKLEYINAELDFEAENLLAGALRLVLNETGTLEQLKSKELFFKQTYEWAKGELTGLYIDVDTKHEAILAEENLERDASKQMDMETYKLILVNVGKHKESLLLTFKEMINQALEKTKRLRNHNRLDDAITAINYMQSVSKDVTTTEANVLLTQILEI